MPVEFELKTLRTKWELGFNLPKSEKSRFLQLNRIDEMRMEALYYVKIIQNRRKVWHDKHIVSRKFKKGDWALLFDSSSQEFRGKFHTRWLGPYEINEVYNNGEVKLLPIDGKKKVMLVNGHRLKVYDRPTSKEDFLSQLHSRIEHFIMEVITFVMGSNNS